MNWGTVLTVGTQLGTVSEFVDVGNIVGNLVALELHPGSLSVQQQLQQQEGMLTPDKPVASLSDRIIRAWSELARTSGAFAHLRVLRLCNQVDVSGLAVLRFLRLFPALRVVIIRGCPKVAALLSEKGNSGTNLDDELEGWRVGCISELMDRGNHNRHHANEGGSQWNEDDTNVDADDDDDDGYSLYDCYEASFSKVDANTEHTTTISRDTPILDYQIGWIDRGWDRINWNRAKRRRLRSETRPIVLFRKRDDTSTMDSEDGENARLGLLGNNRPGSRRRPVMRSQKVKDLGSILGEFK